MRFLYLLPPMLMVKKKRKAKDSGVTRIETRYPVSEVANRKILGVGQRSLRQLIKDEKLRVQRIKTEGMRKPRVFIPESALKEFLEKYTLDDLTNLNGGAGGNRTPDLLIANQAL